MMISKASGVYALVHFLQRPPETGPVTWSSGFVTLGQMFRGFLEFEALVPGFLTLTLAGLILGLAYQRTGNLYASMGLHAGWVFWRCFAATFARRPHAVLRDLATALAEAGIAPAQATAHAAREPVERRVVRVETVEPSAAISA